MKCGKQRYLELLYCRALLKISGEAKITQKYGCGNPFILSKISREAKLTLKPVCGNPFIFVAMRVEGKIEERNDALKIFVVSIVIINRVLEIK